MSKKLLLADDSVTIQRVIELTFSGEDVQVLAVGDGEEAIARIPIEKPDIVLADIGMPKRSGYDVSAFVKNNPALAHIPVLLLAGAFEPVDDAKAQEAKCDGVLVKPFEPQHVIARVRELIGGAKGSPTQPAVQDIPRPAARLAPSRPVELPKREERPPVPADLMDMDVTDLAPQVEESQAAVQPIVLDDSLDDYFDKLDEAFTTVGGSGSPAPTPSQAAEPRAARPDRPVLERDLETFDEPTLIDDTATQYIDLPRANAADPFAGFVEVEPEEAAAVPTLDDLLSKMPPSDEPPPITFEPPQPPMIFDTAPAPSRVEGPAPSRVEHVIDLPVQPRVPVPPPIVVAPPSIEPPDVTPTLTPAPSRVEAPPPLPPPTARPAAPVPQAPQASGGLSSRSIIADAFSALLAAEQGEPGATPVRLGGGNGSAPAVTDAMVDDVARRVIEKLALGSSDQMSAIVRQIVSDVAERLVREEIERIRGKA